MIDNDFIKINDNLIHLNYLIEQSMKKPDRDGFENDRIYNKLENFQDELESLTRYIERMQHKAIEGHLELNSNERYSCPEADIEFTCGSSIEVFIKTEYDEGEWYDGRIEFKFEEGYYFYNYNGENVLLHEGMRVRVRI